MTPLIKEISMFAAANRFFKACFNGLAEFAEGFEALGHIAKRSATNLDAELLLEHAQRMEKLTNGDAS